MNPLSVSWFLAPLAVMSPAAAGDVYGKLPSWAEAAAREAARETPPADAEAWVLLSRTEVAYAGDGTLRVRMQRLVKVLKGRGMEEAGFHSGMLREGAQRLLELRGWNLRPDGEMVTLGRRDRATVMDLQGEASFDTSSGVVALLPRVMDGSLVAYECALELKSMVDVPQWFPLDRHPVRRWELQAIPGEGQAGGAVRSQMNRVNFASWGLAAENLPDGTLRVANLPALPEDEPFQPEGARFLPWVGIRFTDPQWSGSLALDSWENFSAHYHKIFAPHVLDVQEGGPPMAKGLEGLRALWRWFAKELTYKQVYLTPTRNVEPLNSTDVARKRYGDCKDLSCLFLALARKAGFEGFPVLARIGGAPLAAEDALGPVRDPFNHAIAALRLDHSLGLPGEIETPKGRFLLVDPTNPFIPLGSLGSSHRDGRVLLLMPAGGFWLEVPAAAIVHGDLDIAYQGRADLEGTLTAEVRLKETGNFWYLRSLAHGSTAKNFRAYIEGRCLDSEINGRLEVVSTGDPLDLERPFEVLLKVTDPRGLTRQGSDLVLRVGLGLPSPPRQLARPGKKRRSAVAVLGEGHIAVHGSIAVPNLLRPVAPERREDTCLRTLSWKVAAEPAGEGCTLTFQVDQRLKDASFGLDRIEAALDAWRQDRAAVRGLLQDGLALKP